MSERRGHRALWGRGWQTAAGTVGGVRRRVGGSGRHPLGPLAPANKVRTRDATQIGIETHNDFGKYHVASGLLLHHRIGNGRRRAIPHAEPSDFINGGAIGDELLVGTIHQRGGITTGTRLIGLIRQETVGGVLVSIGRIVERTLDAGKTLPRVERKARVSEGARHRRRLMIDIGKGRRGRDIEMTKALSAAVIIDQLEAEHSLLHRSCVVMHLDAVDFLQITDPPRRHLRETLGANIVRRNATLGLKRLDEPTLARDHGLRKVRPDQIGNVIHLGRLFAPAGGRELDRLSAGPDLPRRYAGRHGRPTRIRETTALALPAQNNRGGARVGIAADISRRADRRGSLMRRNAGANVAGKTMGPRAQGGGTGHGLVKIDLSHNLAST